MIIAILVVLGLILGSFVNALVWRLRQQELAKTSRKSVKSKVHKVGNNKANLSIATGRSVCVRCGHELAVKDLVPVFSWLALRGKCRYCHKSISWQYPVVEAATAVLFVLSYVFWPTGEYTVHSTQYTVNFIGWLVILTGFIALAIYDIRWMLLPNRIIYPLTVLASLLAAYNVIAAPDGVQALQDTLLSVLIAGGLFWGLFMVSRGKWIGGGDVKLGLLIGLVLADPYEAFLMLLLASALGTVFVLPGMLLGKFSARSRIPFGPFLIAAAILVVWFGSDIIGWYREMLLLQ